MHAFPSINFSPIAVKFHGVNSTAVMLTSIQLPLFTVEILPDPILSIPFLAILFDCQHNANMCSLFNFFINKICLL